MTADRILRPLRWPVVCHIRALWLEWCLDRHLDDCRRLGLGFHPQQSDLIYIKRVWRGEA